MKLFYKLTFIFLIIISDVSFAGFSEYEIKNRNDCELFVTKIDKDKKYEDIISSLYKKIISLPEIAEINLISKKTEKNNLVLEVKGGVYNKECLLTIGVNISNENFLHHVATFLVNTKETKIYKYNLADDSYFLYNWFGINIGKVYQFRYNFAEESYFDKN